MQRPNPEFTTDQEHWLCGMIGDWYLHWKSGIAGNAPHKLGYAKEHLKALVCADPQYHDMHYMRFGTKIATEERILKIERAMQLITELKEYYVPKFPADFLLMHALGFLDSLLTLEAAGDDEIHRKNIGIK